MRLVLLIPLFLIAVPITAPVAATEPFVAGFDRFPSDNAAGHVLLTELSCTACHRSSTALAPKRGPVLDGAANRYRRAWLKRYLLDPAATKPGTTMPQVLHQLEPSEREQAADELIALLAAQPTPEPKIVSTALTPVPVEFWNKGDADQGQVVYHQVGCVACHAIDAEFQPERPLLSDLQKRLEKLDLDPDEIKELGLKIPQPIRSVPHGDLAAKYTRRSMSMFLVAPHLLRPSLRMPDLRLIPTDAAHIAAYLLRDQPSEASSSAQNPNAELARRGAVRFQQLGCVQCHSVGSVQAAKTDFATPLNDLTAPPDGSSAGCIGAEAFPRGPHFPLAPSQRKAILAALKKPPSNDALHLTMRQLNCFACHQRAGKGGVGPQRYPFFETAGHVDLGDEGRIPPPLDYVGAKLTSKWLEKVFQGKGSVRPHFKARMPSYATAAKQLTSQLKEADAQWNLAADPVTRPTGEPPSAPPGWLDAKPRAAHIEAGRQLLNLGCVQCHPIGGEHLPGVVGVDLADLRVRIEPRWLHAFLLDPAKLKTNTRMPTFFPNGKSSNQEVYDGDLDRQISAIWAYLNSSERKLPDKLEQGKAHNFELTPAEHPIVLRTFMKAAPTNAIAVGFPESLHYTFDAERVSTVQLWKGRFLNAHSTWFNRFVPPAEPLGKVLTLPKHTIIGFGPDPPDLSSKSVPGFSPVPLEFQGYELDQKRVPTLLYRSGPYQIRERLAPTGAAMRRRIAVLCREEKFNDQTLWLWLATDVRTGDDGEVLLPGAGRIQLSPDVDGKLLRQGSRLEFTAPLQLRSGKGSLEATYQW